MSGVNDVRDIINEVVDKDDINYNKVTHIMNRSIDKLKVNHNNYYEDNMITIDFHVIVSYGISINTVAENLTETVKYKVESFTGLKIKKINIHVEGVRVID